MLLAAILRSLEDTITTIVFYDILWFVKVCVYVFSSCILSFVKTKALGDGGGRLDGPGIIWSRHLWSMSPALVGS